MKYPSFHDELASEESFYVNIFKPYIKSLGWDVIFLRYNNDVGIFDMMQRKYDIDAIVDTGSKNVSVSLKVVKKQYNNIFFETVSNCSTGTTGWGYYSAADYICYAMDAKEQYLLIFFKASDIRRLNIEQYPVAYGKTYINGRLVYETKGHLIPITNFENNIVKLDK